MEAAQNRGAVDDYFAAFKKKQVKTFIDEKEMAASDPGAGARISDVKGGILLTGSKAKRGYYKGERLKP